MLILGNVNSSVLFNENKIIVSPQIQIKTRKKWGTLHEDVIGAYAHIRM